MGAKKRVAAGVAGVVGYKAAQAKRFEAFGRKRGLGRTLRKLGIFGKGASAGSDADYTLPPLEQPERVTNKAGPELSTIEEQLNELAKVVFKIAVAMNKQQDTLIKQAKRKERDSNEALLERPAQLENNSGSGDLTPLGDTFSSLIQKINELTGVIDEKINNGEGSGGGGASDLLAGAAGGALLGGGGSAAVKKPGLISRGVSGIGRAAGAGVKMLGRGIAGIGPQVGGKFEARAAKSGELISRGMSSVASMAKTQSGKLAGMFGSTVKKIAPNASKVVGAATIKKLAGPIIGKALGKTALKSIPIIGAVAGLGFAVSRLMDGDVVGAGLDAVSGLAGPFTAIPALIASVARDVYIGAYGTSPETDALSGERMSMVTGAVKDLVSTEIRDKAEVKEPATGKKSEPKLPTVKPIPTQNKQGGKEPKIPAVSKPSPSSMGPQNSADSSDVSQKVGFDVNKPLSSSPSNGSDVSQKVGFDVNNPSANKSDAPEITPSPKPEAGYDERSIEPEPNKANTGTDIQKASMENETLANSEVPNIQTARNELPKPSKDITSRNGATGIGNVPDPTYGNMGSIAQQLYFGAAV